MSIDKRLISTNAADCNTDTLDIFGDSSCIALYGLNYDGSDASGNYDGTPSNVTFNAPGHIDYAASFNGSNSKIDVNSLVYPVSLKGTINELSISLWFKSNASPTAAEEFVTWWSGDVSDVYLDGFLGFAANNTIRFGDGWGSAYTFPNTNYVGSWTHIVAVKSIDNAYLYINGSLVSTKGSALSWGFNRNLIIGGDQGSAEYFNGSLDQIRLFDKALSSSEVTTLYEELACNYTCTTDTNGFPTSASSNLVAYYKLDNDATDETGSYNGTETSITYDGGRYGSAAVFNGTASDIQINSNFSLDTSFTVSFWMNKSGTGSDQVMFQFLGDTTNVNCNMLGVYASGTKFGFFPYNTLSGAGLSHIGTTETTALLDGNWHHVAIVTDGTSNTSTKFYIDGIEKTVTTENSYTTTWRMTGDISLGERSDGADGYNGKLDQLRLYNSPLSSTEVSSLYEEEHQCYIAVDSTDPFGDGDNIALYEFENNANDSTGSYNGTVTGTVSYSTDSVIGAYSVEFSSGHINTGHNFNLANNSFSFSFWFANSATGSTNSYVISTDGPQTQNNHLLIGRRDSNGKLNFAFYANDLNSATNVTTDGTWQHWVCTYDASTNARKIYLNGSLDASDTASADYQGTGNVEFGFGIYQAYGKLDQVRIFDRALNGDEIWKLYAEGAKG